MESTTEFNFIEDLEHESREVEYKDNQNKSGLSSEDRDECKSIFIPNETLCLPYRASSDTNKGISRRLRLVDK